MLDTYIAQLSHFAQTPIATTGVTPIEIVFFCFIYFGYLRLSKNGSLATMVTLVTVLVWYMMVPSISMAVAGIFMLLAYDETPRYHR